MRILLLCLFAAISLGPVAATPVNFDRELVLTPASGNTAEDREISRWQQRAEAPNAKAADFERLGWAFVAKARRTLDAGFFRLALKTADVMDARFGVLDSAALLRGHAFHNLHRFREAESVARTLTEVRGLADDYALLSDALMEQGRIDEAIVALQRAADLKPGAEADTRIAHIRWLKGDLNGAIAAMSEAVRETSPLDQEPMAWMLAQLAGFELENGNVARAAAMADAANKHLPDFPPALLAQGRVALVRHETDVAIARLRRAAELNPLPDYQWWLADALQSGRVPADASKVSQQIVSTGVRSDPRTAALYLATIHQHTREAVDLCQAELTVRGDVHTHDALAWALFAAGDVVRAGEQSRAALALGTADSRLRLHAAVIAIASGRSEDARTLLAKCEPASLRPSEQALYQEAMTHVGIAARPSAARFAANLCRP